jgi:hypothetical protein
VNVVAVPATTATCAKVVQPDPAQRSILTSVWLGPAFVHLRLILRCASAVAVSPVGAAGACPCTTIERELELEAPELSVTLKDAV